MPTVREYFVREAGQAVSRLRQWLERAAAGEADAAELHATARELRGSAQLAREERVGRAASALESGARTLPARDMPAEDVRARLERTVQHLEALVAGTEPEDQADRRLAEVLELWRATGEEPHGGAPSPVPSAAAAESAGQGGAATAAGDVASEFLRFAAAEAAGVVGELGRALPALERGPRDRDPLKQILRRQRALLGAARLERIPALAEAMEAVDEVTRLVARHDAAVVGEWLAFYHAARDVLAELVPDLERGGPGSPVSMPRLRALRERLAGPAATARRAEAARQAEPAGPPDPEWQVEAVPPAAAASAEPVEPARRAPPADGIVPIEALVYRGEAALARALELRPVVQRAAGADPEARAAVDELFDLIRLGQE